MPALRADPAQTTRPRLSQADLQLRLEELEGQLQAAIAEREAAYREIDDLARFISHDLRAPLRGIDGYSKALMEDYAGGLDEVGMAYLEFIFEASRQAAGLIDKLIYYIRVQRAEMQPQPIDLSQMGNDLALRLQAGQPERRVEWLIAPGLFASGDHAMLQQLLKNLLENAWKFSAKQAMARIELGREAGGEGEAFFVSDNGAGFNMDYREQLFLPFQRLHTSHEFEGAGMGLAIARRIVERHGGRIWAQAEEGQGATFYFTLAR